MTEYFEARGWTYEPLVFESLPEMTAACFDEIFERHFGSQSGINLHRGLCRLWTHGGLMYAPPFR